MVILSVILYVNLVVVYLDGPQAFISLKDHNGLVHN